MQVIIPVPLALHGSGTPVYVHSEWASGQNYIQTESIVRVDGGGGLVGWHDYRCKISHTSSASNAPTISANPFWILIGSSAILSGTTPTTNVMLTRASSWVSNNAVSAGSMRFDPSDMCDYVATIGIASGDNLIRPSTAVLSLDSVIASRWIKNGVANAWAFMDYEMDSFLAGINSSGTIVNPVFKVSIESGSTPVNRVALTGLVNVKTVTIKVYVSNNLTETKTATITATTFNIRPQSAVIELTSISTAADIEITLTRDVSTFAPQMRKLAIGYGYEISHTHWGVETGIISLSRKQRDPTYGTVIFKKRNSAKRLRAQCSIRSASVTGDAVQRVLESAEGRPVFWDFNNADTTFDRCRIFGFCNDFSISPLTNTYELLTISVEGLVSI